MKVDAKIAQAQKTVQETTLQLQTAILKQVDDGKVEDLAKRSQELAKKSASSFARQKESKTETDASAKSSLPTEPKEESASTSGGITSTITNGASYVASAVGSAVGNLWGWFSSSPKKT